MNEAFEKAVAEHLGPATLTGGKMSIYQCAEIMFRAGMLAAQPEKAEPERKHETVPTLAEPSEYAKSFQDMITHGYSFMKDGMRIPPEDVIEPAEPDCECGAVASEHCPACEPVAQEPVSAHDAVVVDRKRVWIKVGNQSFMLSYEPEDEPEMSAWQQAEWYAGQLRKALSRITHGVKTETAVAQAPVVWECFEDTGYYNMWAVRPVVEKQWGKCFHVINGAEAESLCAVLNTQPDQSAEAQREINMALDLDDARERIAELEAEVERLREYHEG